MVFYNLQLKLRKSVLTPMNGRPLCCWIPEKGSRNKWRDGRGGGLEASKPRGEGRNLEERRARITDQDLTMNQTKTRTSNSARPKTSEESSPKNRKTNNAMAEKPNAPAAGARERAGKGTIHDPTGATPAATGATETRTDRTEKRTVKTKDETPNIPAGADLLRAGLAHLAAARHPIPNGADIAPRATATKQAKGAQVPAGNPRTPKASGAEEAGKGAKAA